MRLPDLQWRAPAVDETLQPEGCRLSENLRQEDPSDQHRPPEGDGSRERENEPDESVGADPRAEHEQMVERLDPVVDDPALEMSVGCDELG